MRVVISAAEIAENRRACADTVSRRLISQKRVAPVIIGRRPLRRYRRNIAEAINLSCSQDVLAVSRRFCSPVRVMIRGTRDNPPPLLSCVSHGLSCGLVTSTQRIDDPETLPRNVARPHWIFRREKFARTSWDASKRPLFHIKR